MSADAPSPGREQHGEVQPAGNAGMKLPRAARLLKHSDFERVYKQGRRHFSAHMTVFYLARAEDGANGVSRADGPARTAVAHDRRARDGRAEDAAMTMARVGFTVGRPLGGAVARNRIKRRLREAVRLRRSALPARVDVVINPKKSVLRLDFPAVLDEVGRAFDVISKTARRKPGQEVKQSGTNKGSAER